MIDSKEERDREWINVEKCCDRAWELWSHDFRHLPIMIGNNENFPLKIFLSKRENLVTSSPGPRRLAGHLWSEVKDREISLVVIQQTMHYAPRFSKCEVKALLCWGSISLPPLRYYVKSNFDEFKWLKNVIFSNSEALNLDFRKFVQFSSRKFTKIHSLESLKKGNFLIPIQNPNFAKSDFT